MVHPGVWGQNHLQKKFPVGRPVYHQGKALMLWWFLHNLRPSDANFFQSD